MIRIKKRELFGFFLLLLVSCSKISDPNAGTQNMTCKINSIAWSGSGTATVNGGMLTIKGSGTDGQTISITLADTVAGSYALNHSSGNSAGISTDSLTSHSFVTGLDTTGVGTVMITSIDNQRKTVSGTFSFDGERSSDHAQKIVTEGHFTNLPLTIQAGSAISAVSADIDGASWATNTVVAIPTSGKLGITATNSNGSVLTLLIPVNATAGTYSVVPGTYTAQYQKGTNQLYTAQTGSITISVKTPKEVSGSFQFTGANVQNAQEKVNISNGIFDVKL